MSLNNFTGFKNPSHYTVNTFNRNGFEGTNFNNAFKNQATLIPPRDTKNYGNTIINNIGENIVNEVIMEYTLHIDSCDRDINLFPNPYQFAVSIGGAGSSTITHANNSSINNINNSKNKNGFLFNTVSYSGAPGPRIDTQFRNVKYIKLKYITLPRIISYTYTSNININNRVYTPYGLTEKGATILGNYRYLIMRIKEIANDNFYSTNADIKNNCFILYRDSNYYDAINDLWIATQPIKIFYDDDLKNLSKMTIEIFLPPNPQQQPVTTGTQPVEPQTNAGTSYAIQQTYTNYGYPIPQDTNLLLFTLLTKDATGNIVPLNVTDVNGTSGTTSDFYSKYGSTVQMSMEFELGVCENQLNTGKNYR